MDNPQFIVEKSSKFSFDETVELLMTHAVKKSWSVPAVHNLQESIAKSGRQVKPVKVIEICKPEYSGQLMALNHERIVSVMMPCRISVYEKNDGKIYVALINSAAVASGMAENIAKVMKAASDETFEIVKAVTG